MAASQGSWPVEPSALREIPGSYGSPVFGRLLDTIQFLRGWRRFYAVRQARYASNVFRAAAGLNAITVLDQRGIQALFDTTKVSKMYGFGAAAPPLALIGNHVPTVFTNDEEHLRQKEFLLELQRQNLPRLIGTFDSVAAPYFERWEQRRAFDWGPETDALMSDVIFQWLLEARPDSRDVDGWALHLLPHKLVKWPWESDAPVRDALHRLLAVIREAPRFPEAAQLASRIAGLDAEQTTTQLLFYLGFNAWSGLQSVVRSILAELSLNPEVLERVAGEVRTELPGGTVSDLQSLSRLTQLSHVIQETLRLHQPAPFAYGVARHDFVLDSDSGCFQVRKDEVVHGVLGYAHRDPRVFDEPDRFNPDRFNDPALSYYLIWSNGHDSDTPRPEDKMCAGKDIVYLVMQLFFAKLLGTYRFTLAERPRWPLGKLTPANRPETPMRLKDFSRIP